MSSFRATNLTTLFIFSSPICTIGNSLRRILVKQTLRNQHCGRVAIIYTRFTLVFSTNHPWYANQVWLCHRDHLGITLEIVERTAETCLSRTRPIRGNSETVAPLCPALVRASARTAAEQNLLLTCTDLDERILHNAHSKRNSLL